MGSALMQGMSRVTEQEADADAPLIERVANGGWPALASLYDRYRIPLFHYLLQLTSDHGLAEELLRDTLVAVWKGAHTFRSRSRVQTPGCSASLAGRPTIRCVAEAFCLPARAAWTGYPRMVLNPRPRSWPASSAMSSREPWARWPRCIERFSF